MAGEPCILLVDDDLKVLSVLTRALQSGGFQVTPTTSAKEALDLLARKFSRHGIGSQYALAGRV
jgi:CheY-like chemotaxis protein